MKDIPGFEGRYAVTRDGKIWSHPKQWVNHYGGINKRAGHFMSLDNKTKRGYVRVAVDTLNRRGKYFLLHRLIAQTYIPNPNKLPDVNHKNGIKTDNSVKNLEWCTPQQNFAHAKENGLYSRGEKHYASKLSKEDVLDIRKMHSQGGTTYSEIAKRYSVLPHCISKIVRRVNWKHV